MIEEVKISICRENAKIPEKATVGSAGFDIYACLDKEISISYGDLVKILCGFSIELPNSEYAAFIFARSSLGVKYGIMPANGVGVIDSDYRGEVQIGLCRVAKGDPYIIKNGDRIAQMIIMKVENFKFRLADELSKSSRGTGGLGSTGR